jgi:hypothetical protein
MYDKMRIMPKKKKVKKFRAVETVKAMARERIGAPKPSRIVLDRKKKEARRKPRLGEMLED